MKFLCGIFWIFCLINGVDYIDIVGFCLDNRCGIFDCDVVDVYNWNVDVLVVDCFDERYILYSFCIFFCFCWVDWFEFDIICVIFFGLFYFRYCMGGNVKNYIIYSVFYFFCVGVFLVDMDIVSF